MSKDRYIGINGEKTPVTEEVYRAYKRPAWRERKQREIRTENERSLDAFVESGFDIPSQQELIDEIVADKILLDELYAALDGLSTDERALIDGFFFQGQSEREMAAKTGIPRNTVVYRKNKILDKLKKILKNSKIFSANDHFSFL